MFRGATTTMNLSIHISQPARSKFDTLNEAPGTCDLIHMDPYLHCSQRQSFRHIQENIVSYLTMKIRHLECGVDGMSAYQMASYSTFEPHKVVKRILLPKLM